MIFCRITMLVLIVLNVGIHLGKNGEPKNGRYNFVAQLIAAVIEILLLWGGGFFG